MYQQEKGRIVQPMKSRKLMVDIRKIQDKLQIGEVKSIHKGSHEVTITRVPEGWIYTTFSKMGVSSVFVPSSDQLSQDDKMMVQGLISEMKMEIALIKEGDPAPKELAKAWLEGMANKLEDLLKKVTKDETKEIYNQ